VVDAVLLDTHALVWWVADPERLSNEAGAAIHGARRVLVSAASAWEVALLADAGRIALDRPIAAWLSDVADRDRTHWIPIDASLAAATVALGRRGFHRDPADRFVYATAALVGAPLVSKDAAMAAFARADGGARVIW